MSHQPHHPSTTCSIVVYAGSCDFKQEKTILTLGNSSTRLCFMNKALYTTNKIGDSLVGDIVYSI